MTDKLQIPPDQPSYSVVHGNETLRVQLDGGAGRYRRDLLGAHNTVTAQWTLDGTQYSYLMAFHRTTVRKGSLPFLLDLKIDSSEMQEYSCYFVPESLQLISHAGLTYVVAATLEVKPQEIDEDYDNALVMLFEAYGSSRSLYLSLEQLVNISLPTIEPP